MNDMEPPRESPLPPGERQALRERLMSAVPASYSPYRHAGLTFGFGLAVIAGAIASIRGLDPLHLMTIPIVYVFANATEWRAHRYLLHHRSKLVPLLYDRHTPQHHMIFNTDDMAVRNAREWRYVLIPSYAVILIAALNAPIAGAIWLLGYTNVALLYIASTVGYVLLYEALHLAFHLAPDRGIGGWSIIRVLRRHHAVHHDPRLMQRYNFNVTVPLWDLVRRTYVAADDRETFASRKKLTSEA
jgi:hypothetical protein